MSGRGCTAIALSSSILVHWSGIDHYPTAVLWAGQTPPVAVPWDYDCSFEGTTVLYLLRYFRL